jgi:hypothetical protein
MESAIKVVTDRHRHLRGRLGPCRVPTPSFWKSNFPAYSWSILPRDPPHAFSEFLAHACCLCVTAPAVARAPRPPRETPPRKGCPRQAGEVRGRPSQDGLVTGMRRLKVAPSVKPKKARPSSPQPLAPTQPPKSQPAAAGTDPHAQAGPRSATIPGNLGLYFSPA